MANPVLLEGSSAEKLDPIVDGSGDTGIKLGIGSKALGSLTPPGKWQGVATHAQGDAVAAADGLVVIAGVDDSGNAQPLAADSTGLFTSPSRGGLTDHSGSIATGGTAQDIVASSATRKYLLIQNNDPAEDMWIDFGVDAIVGQPSFLIPAGGGFVMDAAFVSTDRISVVAATTSHPFTAKVG